jgi:hypothetical protein
MDIQVENFLLNTSNDQSSGIWKLTRAMKAAGWRYKGSSDAVAQDTTGNPNNDKWGAGVQVGAQTATVAFTIAAPNSTKFGGRAVITGLTGFTSTSPGHFLKITGATNGANVGTWLITKYNSATSVDIENPAAIAETTPGTATWTELSALTDTLPANITGASGVGAWWCGQGPSTMKVPIGAATPTGTFIPGENVTQTTSGAQGEFMGIVTDAGGQGYMVFAPRVSGIGSGPRGWSTDLLTGAKSGATITPSTTVIEFVREVVFWKGSATIGHTYYQVIDQASEAAPSPIGTGRFSTMITGGQSTIVICPGGSIGNNPATNGFPLYGTYAVTGTGGSGAAITGTSVTWSGGGVAINLGKCQFLCANAIEDANISADGTFTWAGGTPLTGTTTYEGFGFHRLDDQEDGDVEPYAWALPTSSGSWLNATRTANSNVNSASGDAFTTNNFAISGETCFTSWRRRGYASGGVMNGDSWILAYGAAQGANALLMGVTPTTVDTVACTITSTKVRDPIYVVNDHVNPSPPVGQQTNFKIRKGCLRWWYISSGNAGNDTFDTKRWIQLSSGGTLASPFPIVAGPADGTTTPVNQ